MIGHHFINNQWVAGLGPEFNSKNPATDEVIWRGKAATEEQINNTVRSASIAFQQWSSIDFDARVLLLQAFIEQLKKERQSLSITLAQETGKPLWEADTEIGAMIHKLPVSIAAYQDRCKDNAQATSAGNLITRHRPHGVLAIFGPFNFPGHLPNGHIIPALLAGNTVIFKPSELTPLIAEKIVQCWEKAKIPAGVINLIQGDAATGEALVKHPGLNGLLFTGSFNTGQKLSKLYANQPEKILALEMGGNNPLIVHNVKNLEAAAYHIIQSAYITTGQRCTCARRLIITKSARTEALLEILHKSIKSLKIGEFTNRPEPFMGPLISDIAARKVIAQTEHLISLGAIAIIPLKRLHDTLPFLSPALLDVTQIKNLPDEEIFGPVLQLIQVEDFELALLEANKTRFGLAAGLLSDEEEHYQQFLQTVRAGVVNWNRPLTGASSQAPFGGIGYSGNHRPSAYYAADYCAYPVACLENTELTLPETLTPGISL